MNESVCIRSGTKEKIREECRSDSKVQDLCKNEIGVTRTSDYVAFESIDIKYEPLETPSCLVAKDETGQYTKIKKDFRDECLGDPENGDFHIITQVDEANSINIVKDIKSEEIDIKDEPHEDIRLSTVNGDTLTHTNFNSVDGKSTTSGFVMKYQADTEKNVSANLGTHTLLDDSPPEILMYACNTCPYKALQKSNLKIHMLTHTNPSERETFECYTCGFKTWQKSYLSNHMLVHADPSKITMYECNACLYKTRRKSNLHSHMLTHTCRPSPKVAKYECDTCEYKTGKKSNLKTHLLVHTDPSNKAMYECYTCGYKTRRKSNLQDHLLVHIDPSKRPTYECYTCGFKTRRKSNLPSHMLVHADPSKIVMYECNTCPYKTQRKSNLHSHMLGHRSPKIGK